ncbi:MAG: glycosyltransferase [Bacillus sp. (in: Bacteria)]|nr:glycosyltransferase [Bacillus sp. (in: firmicutes)]MCM1425854.1 glycosyltransferase [Eubacterium sp.]
MRFVLFHEYTSSFNYFISQIAEELQNRGHETFILDLLHTDAPGHSLQELTTFCTRKIDVVISIDRIGIHDDYYINLWNLLGACCVNILMDHPLRFHPTMEHHPNKYIQFCPDMDHVSYVKTYFPEVEHVEFLPHAGTIDDEEPIPYMEKEYDIFFSATYYPPDSKLGEIEQYVCPKDSPLYQIYMQIAQHLLTHTGVTVEQAVLDILSANHMDLSNESCRTIVRGMSPIDWMVRMYYRSRAIQILVDAGFHVHVLGRGWEDHPCAGADNLHIINGRVDFADTFPYIRNARINLNVMPWFKAGTHDRIFNTMLRHSICLTDSSSWIDAHYTDREDIVLFHLDELERLPEIAGFWLSHPDEAEILIAKAKQKTAENFVWKNCVDSILESLERNYNIYD